MIIKSSPTSPPAASPYQDIYALSRALSYFESCQSNYCFLKRTCQAIPYSIDEVRQIIHTELNRSDADFEKAKRLFILIEKSLADKELVQFVATDNKTAIIAWIKQHTETNIDVSEQDLSWISHELVQQSYEKGFVNYLTSNFPVNETTLAEVLALDEKHVLQMLPTYYQQIPIQLLKTALAKLQKQAIALQPLVQNKTNPRICQWILNKNDPEICQWLCSELDIPLEELPCLNLTSFTKFYQHNLTITCLNLLLTNQFQTPTLSQIRVALPDYLQKTNKALIAGTLQEAAFKILAEFISQESNYALCLLLCIVGSTSGRILLAEATATTHKELAYMLRPSTLKNLITKCCLPMKERNLITARATLTTLIQTSPKGFLLATGIDLTRLAKTDELFASIKNQLTELDIKIAAHDLLALSKQYQEVMPLRRFYKKAGVIIGSTDSKPDQWQELKQSLYFSLILVKAFYHYQQTQQALGKEINPVYKDYVFKQVKQHSLQQFCKLTLEQEQLGLREDSFFIYVLEQKDSPYFSEVFKPFIANNELQSCIDERLYKPQEVASPASFFASIEELARKALFNAIRAFQHPKPPSQHLTKPTIKLTEIKSGRAHFFTLHTAVQNLPAQALKLSLVATMNQLDPHLKVGVWYRG